MIPDDIIPVAFAVASSPKRYALLLGSGVSGGRLPTGRGITRDLIRRIAALSMERIERDPLEWYRNRYREEPTFPGLFKTLRARGGDEEAILDEYFTIQDHLIAYLGDLKQRAAGSNLFGGDLSVFEKAHRNYAKGFGIGCPGTGIDLPDHA